MQWHYCENAILRFIDMVNAEECMKNRSESGVYQNISRYIIGFAKLPIKNNQHR